MINQPCPECGDNNTTFDELCKGCTAEKDNEAYASENYELKGRIKELEKENEKLKEQLEVK